MTTAPRPDVITAGQQLVAAVTLWASDDADGAADALGEIDPRIGFPLLFGMYCSATKALSSEWGVEMSTTVQNLGLSFALLGQVE